MVHMVTYQIFVLSKVRQFITEFDPPTTALGAHSSGTTVLQSGRNETMIYDIDRGKIIIRTLPNVQVLQNVSFQLQIQYILMVVETF